MPYSIPCPVMQGFWKKYNPTEGRRGDFFQNLYNLAGQKDTELLLHNEGKGGNSFFLHKIVYVVSEDVSIYCIFVFFRKGTCTHSSGEYENCYNHQKWLADNIPHSAHYL